MDNTPKELENTYFSYAKLFEIHLIPLLTREIIIKDEDDRRLLTIFIKHFEEHPENFPFYIESFIEILKVSFYPKVLDIYPHKTSTEIEAFFRNPFVYASDYFFCFIHEGHDDAKILKKHILILQTFGALVRAQQAYYNKLEKEIYGKKIFDIQFNHKQKALDELKKRLSVSLKSKVEGLDNLPPFGESESIIVEAIDNFLNKRKKEAKALGDYLPEEIPKKIRLFIKAISSNKDSAEKAQICSDAVKGRFRYLKKEVHSLLVNAIRKAGRQKRGGGKEILPLPETFTFPLYDQENNFERPYSLEGENVVFNFKKVSFSEKEKRLLEAIQKVIQKGADLTEKGIYKRLDIDRKTYAKWRATLRNKYKKETDNL